MAHKSEIVLENQPPRLRGRRPPRIRKAAYPTRTPLEVAIVFILIMAAIWTPQGPVNAFFSIAAAACVVGFAITGPWKSREMGFHRPFAGTPTMLVSGAVLCGIIGLTGFLVRSFGVGYVIPWNRSWQYAIWALVQEFLLQSIFFLRCEAIFGSRRAVLVSAALYAIAHLPSPLLTLLSFVGGLLFCEFFRRWRNLYPLGVIHAALGLTIAASLPDKWLHHMRVGIGYLTMHS